MSDETASDPLEDAAPAGTAGHDAALDGLLDGVRSGTVTMDDFRITPDTLRHQADVARAHANPQLAENLERAAELVDVPDEEVLALYELLRPRRATATELEAAAASLAGRGAVRNAAFVREAAAVYARRGLLRPA
ncbi:MAG: diol dehydratase small subunit [Kineosporiaceae bacterium]